MQNAECKNAKMQKCKNATKKVEIESLKIEKIQRQKRGI